MASPRRIIQGQSFTLSLSLSPAENISTWTCKIQAADNRGNTLFTKDITTMNSDSTAFEAFINETDSLKLTTGRVKIGYELKKVSTGENSPGAVYLEVKKDAVI